MVKKLEKNGEPSLLLQTAEAVVCFLRLDFGIRFHIWLWVKTNGTILGWIFSGDWDVHWEYGILTHGHLRWLVFVESTPLLMVLK